MTQKKSSKIFQAAYITSPCEIQFDLMQSELVIGNTSEHPAFPEGVTMQVRISSEALQELLAAIQQLETHPSKPLESLKKPRLLQ